LYGHDSRLLETRQWVLEASGYQVWIGTALAEIERMISIREFHLIVICHSVSAEECGRVLSLARSRLPMIKGLVLFTNIPTSSLEVDGELLYAMDGPAKLVARVARLVGHPNSTTHSHVY
jgi:hypothetical protein